MNVIQSSFPFSPAEQVAKRIINVASVPQLSPFRYPGGKTWLVPKIREWLDKLKYKPEVFIEPFAGGGIASLTAVMEKRAEKAILCELDYRVAAVWETILTHPKWLIKQILSFEINLENVRELLAKELNNNKETAFQTLVRNRTQRGGILAPGASFMKKGENGKGISSRWYPVTLARRIRLIAEYSDKLQFIHGDGIQIVEKYKDYENAVFFVDPPYTAGGKQPGKRLYMHNEINHEHLFDMMYRVRGMFMMTYDNSPEVVSMARKRGFHIERVPMKNTHHTEVFELLITN